MKNKTLLTIFLFLLSFLGGTIAGIGYFSMQDAPKTVPMAIESTPPVAEREFATNEEETEKAPDTNTVQVQTKEQYVVSLSDTKITIYKVSPDGSMQSVEEKKVDTASIPSSDYEKLFSGIVVNTLEEAKIILEDYTS